MLMNHQNDAGDSLGDLWGPSELPLTPPDKCLEGTPARAERQNPWGPYQMVLRQRARSWLADAYRACGRGERATAAAQCGTGETRVVGDEVVCTVDATGAPQCPVRKEHRCGARGCEGCGAKWAARNEAVVRERIDLLDTHDGRCTLAGRLELSLAEAMDRETAARDELKQLGEPSTLSKSDCPAFAAHLAAGGAGGDVCVCAGCVARSLLRSARMRATRRRRAIDLVMRWRPTDCRMVVLTQRDTMFPSGASSTTAARALQKDLDRMTARLRSLSLSPEFRSRAYGWLWKLEQTFNVHDDGTSSWHVHAHGLVWAESYWPQDELQDLWETTRARGEQKTDGVSTWIGRPKKGLQEVLKYAVKPIVLSQHSAVLVGAAWLSATHRRRFLRLGGALDGLILSDGDEAPTVDVLDDEAPACESAPLVECVDPVSGERRTVRARHRTMSGTWVSPTAGSWAGGAAWEEKVRAIRCRVWEVWAVRVRNQGVDIYAPPWMA